MWYLCFAIAFVCHVGVSFILSRRFRSATAPCSVPKPGTVEQCRALAQAANAQQDASLRYQDLMVFRTTTTEEWTIRPWVLVYFVAGLLALAIVLVFHWLL
jgi:hypothetical protein